VISKLLEYDPAMKIKRIFHYDEVEDAFTIETQQDTTDVAEAAKHLHAGTDERARWKGDMHRVASIPMTIYAELEAKCITKDEKAFRAWLNDRDNSVFRTRPGKV
jgi:hypothetical protein